MFGFKKKKKIEVTQNETQEETKNETRKEKVEQKQPEIIIEKPKVPDHSILSDIGPDGVPYPDPDLKLRLSPDNMQAYIKVSLASEAQAFEASVIYDLLKITNITFGVCEEEIAQNCDKRNFYNEFIVAQGVLPLPATDGKIDYFFNTNPSVDLLENASGVVDYRELNLIQSVKAEDILCTKFPPVDGIAGKNIHGEEILGAHGKEVELKSAENTKISEDLNSVIAAVDGCVEYKNGTVSVSEVFTIKGDVDSSIGNLNCVGSIVISGDVREGFTVKAGKNIVIKGMVEGAHIIAGGTVTISSGMNGMNMGIIEAGGDIVSKYFENTTIHSTGGNVYSDVIINCKTVARKAVILKSGKGSLIGGTCSAGVMIYASIIGARTNVPTAIEIKSPELKQMLIPDNEISKKMDDLKNDIEELEKRKIPIQEKALQLEKLRESNPAINEAVINLGNEIEEIDNDLKDCHEKLGSMNVDTSNIGIYKVVVLKTCYSGVKLSMEYLYIPIEDDYSNTKFFVSDHKIIAGQILPSDKVK